MRGRREEARDDSRVHGKVCGERRRELTVHTSVRLGCVEKLAYLPVLFHKGVAGRDKPLVFERCFRYRVSP